VPHASQQIVQPIDRRRSGLSRGAKSPGAQIHGDRSTVPPNERKCLPNWQIYPPPAMAGGHWRSLGLRNFRGWVGRPMKATYFDAMKGQIQQDSTSVDAAVGPIVTDSLARANNRPRVTQTRGEFCRRPGNCFAILSIGAIALKTLARLPVGSSTQSPGAQCSKSPRATRVWLGGQRSTGDLA
jgi:hypothetical protein